MSAQVIEAVVDTQELNLLPSDWRLMLYPVS
jgi:hypothetical protein